jgi:hypothetical protein
MSNGGQQGGVMLSAQSLQQIISLLQGAQQSGSQGAGSQGVQLDPQSLWGDIGNFVSGVGKTAVNSPQVQQAAGSFISNIFSMFSNDPVVGPQFRQLIAQHGQQAGVAPQDIWGDIGGFINNTIVPIAKQAAPTVLPMLFSLLANQPRQAGSGVSSMGNQPRSNQSW